MIGMDVFDRSDAVYCCNADSAIIQYKYLDLEGLKQYDKISMERDISGDRVVIDGRRLTDILKDICNKGVSASLSFSCWNIKRKDLLTLGE